MHYHPAAPSEVEIAAGFDDADDFEFLELVNISQHTLDLSQVELKRVMVDGQEHGVDFHFADGDLTQLGPGQRLLVVEDLAAFSAAVRRRPAGGRSMERTTGQQPRTNHADGGTGHSAAIHLRRFVVSRD